MSALTLLLFLASAFETPPVIPDAPVAQAPAGATFDLATLVPYILPALGLFLVSLLASFWSDYVRRLGKAAPKWMLSVSFALNLAAANPHKAARARAAAAKAAKS